MRFVELPNITTKNVHQSNPALRVHVQVRLVLVLWEFIHILHGQRSVNRCTYLSHTFVFRQPATSVILHYIFFVSGFTVGLIQADLGLQSISHITRLLERETV